MAVHDTVPELVSALCHVRSRDYMIASQLVAEAVGRWLTSHWGKSSLSELPRERASRYKSSFLGDRSIAGHTHALSL